MVLQNLVGTRTVVAIQDAYGRDVEIERLANMYLFVRVFSIFWANHAGGGVVLFISKSLNLKAIDFVSTVFVPGRILQVEVHFQEFVLNAVPVHDNQAF